MRQRVTMVSNVIIDPIYDAPTVIVTGDSEGSIDADSAFLGDFGDLNAIVGLPNDNWELEGFTWSIAEDPSVGQATIFQNGTWLYTVDQTYYDSLDYGEVVTDQFLVLVQANVLNPGGNPQQAFESQLVTITIEGVCFLDGTLISTPTGPVVVEQLAVGQLVQTLDGPSASIKWIEGREISQNDVSLNPALRPVCIQAGALGPNTPNRDLHLSQEHRVLISGPKVELLFGEPDVLIAAKELLNWPGIALSFPQSPFRYFHILLENHEILIAEGAYAESLFLGDESLHTLSSAALRELSDIFPASSDGQTAKFGKAARRLLRSFEAKALIEAHSGVN
ncbi:MAG: Hint domain-containing protein [Pseudoruegeria sp.]